ncbi:MAG: hypothetical protein KJ645_02250, partial [Planctomycetes bacterium]|nr:hypothetical protein [Planctomycetota bacterium]
MFKKTILVVFLIVNTLLYSGCMLVVSSEKQHTKWDTELSEIERNKAVLPIEVTCVKKVGRIEIDDSCLELV